MNLDLQLKKIITNLDHTSAQAFFETMVLNLASILKSDYLFIGKFDFDTKSATTIALAADGVILPNFEYALKDTPCQIVSIGDICCYPKDTSLLYPDDKLLVDMGIEAYIGAPLLDSKKNIIGLMVALCKEPIEDTELTTTLFRIFSGRVAVEIERTNQEETLRKNNTLLQQQLDELHHKDERIKILSLAMQNASDGIMITDENGSILEVNPAFEKIYEITLEDVKGSNPRRFSSGVQDKAFYQQMWHEITSFGKWQGEIINKRLNGSLFPQWISISSIYNSDEDKQYYLAILTDLSEFKKSQILLKQQSKLASMGELLSSIIHQWKQPINVLMALYANIEIKKALETIETSDYRDAFVETKQQVDFMTDTINDFRNFLNPDKKKTTFNLVEGVDEIFTLFASQYKINGLYIEKLSTEPVCVLGYYNEYRQVILNLINNANDAYLTSTCTDKVLILKTYIQEGYGCISIEDKAGGIPENIIQSIFDPYISTKKSSGGTGIGLYMSKVIIEEHMHGHIEVENINKGCRFSIHLPR